MKGGVQECSHLLSSVDGFWVLLALTLEKLVFSDKSALCFPVCADRHWGVSLMCRAEGLHRYGGGW